MAYSPILARFIVIQLVLDHVHHNIVRNESSGIHDLLGFNTKRRLLLHLFAEHVTSCQMADTKLITELGSLRPFSCKTS